MTNLLCNLALYLTLKVYECPKVDMITVSLKLFCFSTGLCSQTTHLQHVCEATSQPVDGIKHIYVQLKYLTFNICSYSRVKISGSCLFSSVYLIKNVFQHVRYFPLSLRLMHCWPPLDFNSFSRFIYSKMCQVNTLGGDDSAAANNNLWHHSNTDSTSL